MAIGHSPAAPPCVLLLLPLPLMVLQKLHRLLNVPLILLHSPLLVLTALCQVLLTSGSCLALPRLSPPFPHFQCRRCCDCGCCRAFIYACLC